MKLRPYQKDILDQIISADTDDIVQLDTGAGKTPIEAELAIKAPRCLLIAHRNILISQISEKLAAFGFEHDTISTEYTRRRCMAAHRRHGRNYIRRGHQTHLVCSISSLVSRFKRSLLQIDTALPWLIIIDEAHHVVPDNQWGMIRKILPNSRVVGFTATPARMDNESLHKARGGLFDRLVQAESLGNDSTRELIKQGYLADFKAYSGPTYYQMLTPDQQLEHDLCMAVEYGVSGNERPKHIDINGKRITPTGLYGDGLTLDGDPIKEYQRLASGKRGIMMCPAIRNAERFAEEFRDAGIPAAAISSKNSETDNARILDAFAHNEIKVLTNVDMVGEGFDLPDCEVLIIATRTASFPRFRQWCGRVLRPAPGKECAIIIDHARQLAGHGLPDEPVEWDLLNPPIGIRNLKSAPCESCGYFFMISRLRCPECGAIRDRITGEVGAFFYDIQRLDHGLVRQARELISDHKANQRLQGEIVMPTLYDGDDMVGKTIGRLRSWFVGRLEAAGVPYADINRFLCSDTSKDRGFWMQHFTAADLEKRSSTKARQAFRKWQKDQE